MNINEDGSKYFRIISWAQFWAQNNSDRPLDANGNEQLIPILVYEEHVFLCKIIKLLKTL